MSNWTPGEWQWWTSNSYRRLRSEHEGRTLDVLYGYKCQDGVIDIAVKEPDMALIAAAPVMYAALARLCACVKLVGKTSVRDLDEAIAEADAAMAQARGETR